MLIRVIGSSDRWFASVACIALLAGCGADGAPLQSFDVQREAITGGVPAEEKTSVLNLLGKSNTCTASLVAPNLILTAKHCVAPPPKDSDFACKANGDIVKNAVGAGDLGKMVGASSVEIHGGLEATETLAKGQEIFTTNSTHICKDDLALILLDQDIDLPLMQLRLNDPVVPNEIVTVVGYGTTGVSGTTVARREKTGLKVLQVGGEPMPGKTVSGAAPPHTFTVGTSACQGDSGGPAIAESSGAVIGLYSIGLGNCTDPSALNIYTRLAAFKGIILDAFEQAGHEPWFEGEDGPGFPVVKPVPTPSQTAEPAPSMTAEPTPSQTIDPVPSAVPEDAGVPVTPTNEPPSPSVVATDKPAPDAGTPDEEDDEAPAAGRRLKSGCTLGVQPESSGNTLWLNLGWLLALGLRRSRRA